MACACNQQPQGFLGEPLFGVAEDVGEYVGGFGACSESTTACSPKAFQFLKAKRGEEGFAYENVQEVEFPRPLSQAYAAREHHCLPFVRVSRDPQQFRSCLQRARAFGRIESAKDVFRLVGDRLAKEDQEVFMVLMLDSQLNVRSVSEIARGARDHVGVPVPDALRIVLVEGASAFVVIHNHPSGNVKPSQADKMLTDALEKAGRSVQVPLFDHVIVGAGEYYSFSDNKQL